jgi:hypothetical protein
MSPINRTEAIIHADTNTHRQSTAAHQMIMVAILHLLWERRCVIVSSDRYVIIIKLLNFIFNLLPVLTRWGGGGSNIFIEKSTIFWDITPCSPLSVNRRFGGTFRFHVQGRRNKFSKKPASNQVKTQRTTRLYIPEDSTLHNQRCENLKSYIFIKNFCCKVAYTRYDIP